MNTRLMWCKNIKELTQAHCAKKSYATHSKKSKKNEEASFFNESPGFFMFGGSDDQDKMHNDLYFVEFNKQANGIVLDKNTGEYKSTAGGQIEMLAKPIVTSGKGPC